MILTVLGVYTHLGFWPALLLLVLLLVNAVYIWSLWNLWCRDFRYRVDRTHQQCASFNHRPDVRSQSADFKRIVQAVEDQNDDTPLPTLLGSRPVPIQLSEELKRRSKPKKTLVRTGSKPLRRLGSSTAPSLDMDHVHVGWFDFLWAYYFIAPNAVFLYVRGIAVLLVRQALHARGWRVMKECEPRLVVGQLLLESMEVLQYTCKREGTVDGEIATFCWIDFPMLDMSGSLRVADLFKAEVHLQSKSMVSATLDGRALTPKEAMILIWFHTIFAGHVKLHAMANWGINGLSFEDKFQQRNAVVTTMYNYFGKSTFPRLAEFWYKWGIARHDFCGIRDVIDHGVAGNIPSHAQTRELMSHSNIVNFVLKVRNPFMNAFSKYSSSLKGIDGEAMMVGTIFHSLDHTLMGWNLQDPLWLDVDSPEFGLMAELGRFVRVGFVPDLPGLLFEKRYKDAPHPFYQEVYRHAVKINQNLADNMDTCIIK